MGGLFMINRKVMGAAGAAAVLGAGAFMVPAAASAHQARTHTLTFVSVTKSNHTFSRTTGASQNTDMKAGKVVGYDELYYRVVSKTAAVFWNTVEHQRRLPVPGRAREHQYRPAHRPRQGDRRQRQTQGGPGDVHR